MGRTPTTNRLDTLQRFVSLAICGITVCMLAVSTGCSKLGSQHGVNSRRFPFSNRTAQSAIESPLQRASRSRQLRREQQANRVPSNPVRETARNVQNVTARPPKLSAVPKTTLFAEQPVTNASQASFEQELSPPKSDTAKSSQSAFDPTAEPPAQIFAQPVQTTPVNQEPAARVASSRSLAPMLFNSKTREVNSTFLGSLRDEQAQPRVAPPNPVQARKTLQPLLVVDREDEAPPAPTRLAEISPFPMAPEMQPMDDAAKLDPIVVSDAFTSRSITAPPVPVSTVKSTPIVDSTMEDHSIVLEPLTTPKVVESNIDVVDNEQYNTEAHGIQIDANLAGDFEAFPEEPPEPKTEPFNRVASLPPPLPTVQAMPVLDPPAEGVMIQSVPEVEKVAESDFEPMREQAKLPETPVFAEHVPDFDPGRNVVPMPVDIASLDSAELVKKNFSNVTFSPTDLPLPRGADASLDTSENQFLAAGFGDTVDHQNVIQTDVPPVGVEALMKLNAVTWQSRLAQTVDLVQEQLNQENIDSDTRTSLEVNLRLLDVLSRQMGDLVQHQQQFSSSENQYWQDQLEAITSMLKVADPVDGRANELLRHHTAHETLNHLRNAVAHLESLANLRVVAGEFCTEVSGYGQFNPFGYNVFPVGQKVLVYCEVENFNSTPQDSENGVSFLTRLRGSYAIYNSSGHAVQQAEFPTLDDVARKRRRDFYMHLPITIGNLEPGNYELHLLVEDLGGNKTASLTPPLNFTVEGNFDPPVARQAKR